MLSNFWRILHQYSIDKTEILNYKRTLDLEQAVIVVTFDYKGTNYKRQYFISYPDNVLVVRFSSDKNTPQNLDFSFNSPHHFSNKGQGGHLLIEDALKDNSLKIASRIMVQTQKGEVNYSSEGIQIKDASEKYLMSLKCGGMEYFQM